jgi:hypothetical protein
MKPKKCGICGEELTKNEINKMFYTGLCSGCESGLESD